MASGPWCAQPPCVFVSSVELTYLYLPVFTSGSWEAKRHSAVPLPGLGRRMVEFTFPHGISWAVAEFD